mmetsp:Transcript_97799/g.281000  ORF Transcript_97799/g.281000 Transcript_97799/m.281000 type:complete len:223 (+) Transcript_97799:279-947(+)
MLAASPSRGAAAATAAAPVATGPPAEAAGLESAPSASRNRSSNSKASAGKYWDLPPIAATPDNDCPCDTSGPAAIAAVAVAGSATSSSHRTPRRGREPRDRTRAGGGDGCSAPQPPAAGPERACSPRAAASSPQSCATYSTTSCWLFAAAERRACSPCPLKPRRPPTSARLSMRKRKSSRLRAQAAWSNSERPVPPLGEISSWARPSCRENISFPCRHPSAD